MGKTVRNNVISIRAPPHRELACGFNGVRATKPRIYGTVEIRTPGTAALAVAYVSLALYCHENISFRQEGRSSLTPQKAHTTTTVGKEVLLWQAPEGRSHEDIISMDIPFMLPFPIAKEDVLPATMVKSSRSTTYELVATLQATQFNSERIAIELIMERFDQLPVWGMFTVPQTLKPMSIDHIVEMTLGLPRTCYGPGDTVSCTATLTGNPDWAAKVKKVRAEKLVMWIDQVVTYRLTSGEVVQKRAKKVAEQKVDFGGLKLLEKPITQRIALSWPKPEVRDKAGLVSTSDAIVPASVSFSTTCKLYTVEFMLHVRATFKGAKDILATSPIVGSRYTMAEADVILENIESAVLEAANVPLVTGVCGEPTIIRKSDLDPGLGDRRSTVVME